MEHDSVGDMSRVGARMQKKWGRLPVGAWLYLLLAVFLCIGIFCLFFIRRDVVFLHPLHTFSVRDAAFFGSAHAISDPLPVAGNRIELLHNGDQIFPAMLGAIRGAKKTINFEAFLFWSDEAGHAFRDALCQSARAGIEVRVLLDGVGSGSKLKERDVDMMKEAGCKFAYYHPTRSFRVDRTNRRTHRRVLVVDGRIGFTGGVGFAKQWLGNADTKDHWRDVQAKIEGPLVAALQAAFQQHWVKETGESLSGPDQFPQLSPAGDLSAQVVASHSFSVAPLPLVQAVSIAAADSRIWITNAYCTPSEQQVTLLTAAVKRGVDVRLLLPGPHNDQPLTKAAGRTAYGKLLEGGVKIYEFQPTMIHSKTMVVDGMFSIFGSSNLDSRSSQINEELDVTVYDEQFGAEMERVFQADLAQSRPYTLEEFRKRTLWERFTEWVMLPFHSQL
jgi:cardiolipin synthase